jgi:hypothetical protein
MSTKGTVSIPPDHLITALGHDKVIEEFLKLFQPAIRKTISDGVQKQFQCLNEKLDTLNADIKVRDEKIRGLQKENSGTIYNKFVTRLVK